MVPFTCAAVNSRGIVGDRGGAPTRRLAHAQAGVPTAHRQLPGRGGGGAGHLRRAAARRRDRREYPTPRGRSLEPTSPSGPAARRGAESDNQDAAVTSSASAPLSGFTVAV